MSDWKKVKIGDVCEIIKGATGIASAEPGEYPLVVTAVERKTCSSFQFDCEAVCIPLVSSSGHGKKSLNNVHYQKGKFALGTILCAVVPNNPNELDARFLHQYLQFYKDKILVPLMKGAANVSLSMKDIAKVEIPLPSIEKQHELSELFVETQKKYKELLEESEKQKSYAKQLRQNILQEAIEGKLTEEWRKENPVVKGNPDFDAEALFEKIQEEKCHTDSELPLETSLQIRNSKKKKVFEPISENEQPFEIPEGWKWVRLGEICDIIGGYAFNSYDLKPTGDNYVLRLGNIRNNQIRYEAKPAFISNKITENLDIYKAKLNDIFLTMTGTRGKQDYLYSVLVSKEHLEKYQMFVNQRVCIIRSIFYPGYVYKTLHSDVLKKPIFESATGSANQANVGIKAINDWVIPFPPLAEQKETIKQVEKLLANVAELEKQITEREEMTKQLMQSIMKDAFREE